MRKYLFLFFLIMTVHMLAGQRGSLLVIGGGSEKEGPDAWNREAYNWAVSQSLNKRVAIIAYGTASNWLPTFFTGSCGAAYAKNFNISNASSADSQQIHDSLLNYDVIFLKGGDQYNYYSTYKGRKTEEAILKVYQRGGVICGTSAGLAVLGGVDFIAQQGSAYPDVVLKNTSHSTITLRDDFLPMLPGIIFDSHFSERGRFGRLLGFLASWEQEHSELLTGIGVDDQTALAIDSNLHARALGSGAVNLYLPGANSFAIQEGKLLSDKIEVSQLLHGWTVDLRQFEITCPGNPVLPDAPPGQPEQIILCSGSDVATENQPVLDYLVNQTGNASDPVLILTRSNHSFATEIKQELENLGAGPVTIGTISLAYTEDEDLKNHISAALKIVFANNFPAELMGFNGSGSAGLALQAKLAGGDARLCFIGNDSRLAGNTVVGNYLIESASYESNLTFTGGLGLLPQSVILPNTYLHNDIYENTATAVPYAMVLHRLRYGIWLNMDNFMIYRFQNGQARFSSLGATPMMLLENKGGRMAHATQTVYGESGDKPRMIAGFESMQLRLIDESTAYEALPAGLSPVRNFVQNPDDIPVHFDPLAGKLRIGSPDALYCRIYNMEGKLIHQGIPSTWDGGYPLPVLPQGIYLVSLLSPEGARLTSKKLLIHNQ